MLNRLRRIVRNEIRPAPEDLNFYAHELREYVRYRRRGWGTGLPADSDEAMDLWRQAHCGAIDDYGLTLHREDLLYHPDALPYIGEIPT